MKSLISIVLLLSINPGQPLTYPIYGTKRYHRTPSSPIIPVNPPSYQPYQLNSYYDNQPILPSSSGSSTGTNQLSSYGSLPYSLTNYPNSNAFISEPNDNYYYYPHHEYHLYGMPTYHGEYKPKPYYYAPAPRYSYFDDREITSNPLDDLHEEILHEDERLQQGQILEEKPAYFGKESWYQNGPTRQDELTNNFLQNLIAYNMELEQQQRQRQLAEQSIDNDYNMQRDQYSVYNNEPESDYDEYSELGDYEYETPTQPIEPNNVLERKKFEKIQANQQQQFLQEQKQRQQYQNKKLNEVDDEDVRQLKNLAKYSKQKEENSHSNSQYEGSHKLIKSNLPSTHNVNIPLSQKDQKTLKPENSVNSVLKSNYNFKSQNKQVEPVEQEPIEESDEWYTPQQSSNSNSEKSSYASEPVQYDEPEEYYEDDGAWISWDRKRSNDNTKLDIDEKFKSIPKRVDLIKAFNDRKPQKLKLINSKSTSTVTTTSSASKSSSSAQHKANKKLTTIFTNTGTTTTVVPSLNNKILGQKEVVLPRPASMSQQFFSAPILNMIDEKSSDSSSKLQHTSSKLQNPLNRNSEAIYKTIKQLISMENQLEQNPKVHKRYVSNEENLVNELDKLKRKSTL